MAVVIRQSVTSAVHDIHKLLLTPLVVHNPALQQFKATGGFHSVTEVASSRWCHTLGLITSLGVLVIVSPAMLCARHAHRQLPWCVGCGACLPHCCCYWDVPETACLNYTPALSPPDTSVAASGVLATAPRRCCDQPTFLNLSPCLPAQPQAHAPPQWSHPGRTQVVGLTPRM
jgi:hypothetical protein